MTDNESTAPVAAAATEPAFDFAADALAAFRRGTPDDEPTRLVRSAYRDLNCTLSGLEVYRKFLYPGATSCVWGDGDRLPARGIRASSRRCTVYVTVPVGTIEMHLERFVHRDSHGKCAVSFLLTTRSGDLIELPHRTLRSRPVYEVRSRPVYEVTLPDGTTIDVPREDR